MDAVLSELSSWFLFDLWVFTRWWVYVTVFPIAIYIPFFFLKWMMVTAPIWLSVTAIINTLKLQHPSTRPRRFF